MKKYILFFVLSIVPLSFCVAQEWLTSLDAAKRIALVQDKMLFMVWEDAAEIPYPVIILDDKGREVVFDNLFEHPEINRVIWEYFVPVKVSEDLYPKLYDDIKDIRSASYIKQFEDDNIKVIDSNGMIVNTSHSPEAYFNLTEFITHYAINTAYLKAELDNYSQHQDFNTAFRLASKYLDYAILVNKHARADIIQVATLYLDDADRYLSEHSQEDKDHLARKIELLRLSEHLIEDRPRKVLRALKKMGLSDVDTSNKDLLAFLYYTAYVLNNDKKDAEEWESQVSSVNLKRAQLIINSHL
ncbi:hypothetical protein BXY82_1555 [Gelidibacter sediminis]|uniref:Uncharacterized protein n=1 Tax=Gelidibacter sediminis TaxID=1608710 RepID=A0A4R7PZ32_9FLAO|nr:hypothetical protein [Gelidibacter sediminis]TDU39529.1 hypothetical protein BXY82_1555 [Gelidibacter sediminis]